LLGPAIRASKENVFADQRTALRPQRPAQPLHRRRSIGTIDVPQFERRKQIALSLWKRAD